MVCDWKESKMKIELEILTGSPFSSNLFTKDKGIPLIRIRDLKTNNPTTFYDGPFDGKYIVKSGEVLVGMDGEFNIIKWKGPDSLLNQRVAKITTKNFNTLDMDFIYYRLQSELKRIEETTPATTVKHLSKKDIENLVLVLPSKNEQQNIAEILSSVDKAIEKTETIIYKTETIKKGLMQQLLTKGIGHTEFKKTKIGIIPVTWEVVSMDSCSDIKSGITKVEKQLTLICKVSHILE